MVTKKISLYILLGQLLIAAVGSACVPVECLRCNVTGGTAADSCPLCSDKTAQCINATGPNCKKGFKVTVSSTGSVVDEGDDITLRCDHTLPPLNLTFGWKKEKEIILEGRNESKLVLKKALSHKSGQYSCFVTSLCGTYESAPHGVTVNNNSLLLLLICGVAALVLIVIMGLAMKYKLQRDNAKHKERMKQRAQAGQGGAPAPFTPKES